MAQQVTAGLLVKIAMDQTALVRSSKQAATSLKQLELSAKNLRSVLNGLGVGFGFFQLGQGVLNAIKVFKEFEFNMAEVRAITNATGKEFKQLEGDAIRLGRSTVFTAREVAKLQVEYGRLGFTTPEILAATEATLNLAAATNTELARAAEVAGSTVRGFQLDASETGRVTDVMTSSFNKSALAVDSYAESMKFVAPIAAAANATVEETTALLAVLANAGIKGSIAGTSLRRIFSDLTRDGRPLQDRLNELGKKGLTLAGAYDEIGRVAQTSLLVLSKNTGQISALASAFGDAAGEAERVANIRLENLEGDVIRLTSAWEGFLLSIQNSTYYRRFIQDITLAFNDLTGQASSPQTLLPRLAETVKKFGIDSDLSFYIDRLKETRKELGRPIDEKLFRTILENAKLSSKEAQFLLDLLRQINSIKTPAEQAVFDFGQFAVGKEIPFFDFKPTEENLNKLIAAADEFEGKLRDSLYNKLSEITEVEAKYKKLAETPRVGGFKGLLSSEKEERDELISSIEEEADAIRSQISAIDQIVSVKKGLVDANKGLIATEDGYIQKLEANLGLLRKAQEEAATGIKAASFAEPIRQVSELIQNAKDGIEPLSDEFKKRAKDIGDSVLSTTNRTINALKDLASKSDDVVRGAFKNFESALKSLQDGDKGLIPIIEYSISKLEKAIRNTFDSEQIQKYREEIEKLQAQLAQLNGEFDNTIDIGPGVSTLIGDLAFAFGAAQVDAKDFGDAVLSSLASFSQQFGQLLIAAGIGKIAFDSFNPIAMIAAGTALVGIAGAIKQTISNRPNLGSGGSSASESYRSPDVFNIQQGMRLELSGVLIGDGRNLITVIDEQGRIGRRTRG